MKDKRASKERDAASDFIGISRDARRIRLEIKMWANSPNPILITGETGTGKELIARALHKSSNRSERPLEIFNCNEFGGDISRIRSDLFGHCKGAYTGAHTDRQGLLERAREGTVFLDEIGDLPDEVQGVLLRVIEYGEYCRLGDNAARRFKGRLVAATNKVNLPSANLRQDLYHRFTHRIHVPPLRERLADIVPLFIHFVERESISDPPIDSVEFQIAHQLLVYPWPGNVRDLINRTREYLAQRAPLSSRKDEYFRYTCNWLFKPLDEHDLSYFTSCFAGEWIDHDEIKFPPDVTLKYIHREIPLQYLMWASQHAVELANEKVPSWVTAFFASVLKEFEEEFIHRVNNLPPSSDEKRIWTERLQELPRRGGVQPSCFSSRLRREIGNKRKFTLFHPQWERTEFRDEIQEQDRPPSATVTLASLKAEEEERTTQRIWDAFIEHDRNVTRTAEALSADRSTIQRYIRKYKDLHRNDK
ncbi:MAG: sigma 54-interacting transcriptional regulator [candidate division Zixibacteria bacterium]|nr:sigma 54-interacting transcriptional regulator [candidate division Zixibacteria bacterium]